MGRRKNKNTHNNVERITKLEKNTVDLEEGTNDFALSRVRIIDNQ